MKPEFSPEMLAKDVFQLIETTEDLDELLESSLFSSTIPLQPSLWTIPEPAVAVAHQNPKSQKTRAGWILSWVLNVVVFLVCFLLVVCTVGLTLSQEPHRHFFRYQLFIVTSDSMRTTRQPDGTVPKGGFRAGDTIIVRHSSPEEVRVGDIISYQMDDGLINTQRVIEILPEYSDDPWIYFQTRGDRSHTEDPPVSSKQFLGIKVFRLPLFGRFLQFLRRNLILSASLGGGLFLTLLLLFVLVTVKVDHKQS